MKKGFHQMKNTLVILTVLILSICGLSACTKQQLGTTGGAALGAGVGDAVGGGWGAAVGAAGGAVAGNRLFDERRNQ